MFFIIKFADNVNMDVFTYYGRKASSVRATKDDDIDFNINNINDNTKKTFSNGAKKKSVTVSSVGGIRGVVPGINGYSARNENSFSKDDESEKIVYKHSRLYNVVFYTCSLVIFFVVFTSVFKILNSLINSWNFSDYVGEEIVLKTPLQPSVDVNPIVDLENISETDLESTEEVSVVDVQDSSIQLDSSELAENSAILTLDEFLSISLNDILDNAVLDFALSQNKKETNYDENGNIVLEDGTILSVDSVKIGEPVTYTDYIVKSGDTIDKITYKHGLKNISTLIAVNDIKNVKSLKAKQKLKIPSQDGLIHTVKSGETLLALSVKYKTSVEEIIDTNDLFSEMLRIGQKLFIPGASLDKTVLRDAMGETFGYPITASWRLTSKFGKRADPFTGVTSSHSGIDMAAPMGTTIKASLDGKVVKAAYSPIFGQHVIIDHGNGYQTLYGHMTRYTVKVGQHVEKGARIGYVGSTGYSTGPHLHFTVYKKGKTVDPLLILKKK